MEFNKLEKIEKLTGKASKLKKELTMIENLNKHLAHSNTTSKVGVTFNTLDGSFLGKEGGLLGAIIESIGRSVDPDDDGDFCDCPACNEKRLENNKPVKGGRLVIEPSTAIKMLGVAYNEKQLELTETLGELSALGIDFSNVKDKADA